MTFPDTRAEIIANPNTVTANTDHLIIGAPVHSGKLPLQAMEC
jgi:acyl-CoA hydrolase